MKVEEQSKPPQAGGARRWQSAIIAVSALLWLGIIGFGYQRVWAYSATAGAAAEAPAQWPAGIPFERNLSGPTVVMLAHPHCPCTRASLTELSYLMGRYSAARAYVDFLRPDGFDQEWVETSIWRSAASIPGTTAVADDNGVEAARFGARTSGQVIVYDRGGKQVFSGGLTPSRGHLGPNQGRTYMTAILSGKKVEGAESLVFGCELQDPKNVSSRTE